RPVQRGALLHPPVSGGRAPLQDTLLHLRAGGRRLGRGMPAHAGMAGPAEGTPRGGRVVESGRRAARVAAAGRSGSRDALVPQAAGEPVLGGGLRRDAMNGRRAVVLALLALSCHARHRVDPMPEGTEEGRTSVRLLNAPAAAATDVTSERLTP